MHGANPVAAFSSPSANVGLPTLPRFCSILHNVPVGSQVGLASCLTLGGIGEKRGMFRLHRVQIKAVELSTSTANSHSHVSHCVWPRMWSPNSQLVQQVSTAAIYASPSDVYYTGNQ